ncbi:SMI1/KNR4 family protein, partial [Saccharothrix sp. ST-888]|uniref:SMI1/KNR4 family protein n=1 Tax=Saccharothrix sp. ST-888 TaxID=1427391 RepID=UPI0005EC14E5
MNPVLSTRQVRQFEERYGVLLPPSYRAFIMTVGDGTKPDYGSASSISRLASSYGDWVESGWPGFLATPFPHTEAVHADDLDDHEWDALTTGSMLIGRDGEAAARLVVTGPAAGQVWSDCLSINDTLYPGPDFSIWYPSRLPKRSR